jgi:hypothetical protein
VNRRPSQLVLKGYGPLAAIVAVLLVVTVTMPSKTTTVADATSFSPDEAVQVDPAAPVTTTAGGAMTPSTAAKGKPAKGQVLG